MAAYQKFDIFVKDVNNGIHNLSSNTLKILLSNTPPVRTNSVRSALTEISAVNGYVAGGNVAAFVSGNQTSGVYKLVLAPVQFVASGGSFGPLQYAVLYNSTTAAGNLIAWWDYGSPVIVTNGNIFTVALDQTNGTFIDV